MPPLRNGVRRYDKQRTSGCEKDGVGVSIAAGRHAALGNGTIRHRSPGSDHGSETTAIAAVCAVSDAPAVRSSLALLP
jgi:hypothetical protein